MSVYLETALGKVTGIISQRPGLTELEVALENKIEKAINYDFLTGKIKVGDKVLLNTTAVKLELGTGGYHFVQTNFSRPVVHLEGPGHIMKLRYTPQQIKVLSVEEEASGYREIFNRFQSLAGFPAIIFSLHSALAPIALSFKLIRPKTKIAYIMTDEGALPAAFSNSLYELKNLGLIDCIVTCGQAFGGDYEAVNIFSALITAKEIVRADAAMVGMGPGNVGTGTKWGFSGTQLGEIINAVNILEGKPVFCPRISFSDPRERHQGISHHSLTVLSKTALTPAITVFPHLSPEKRKILKKQIREMGIEQKHRIIWEYGESGWGKLQDSNLHISTMGRDIHEDKDFFLGACATGIYGAKVSMQVGIN